MNSILLWPERFWPHIGGIEILCRELAIKLKELGYEINIVSTHHPEKKLPDHDEFNGISVYRFHFHTSIINNDINLINKTLRELTELKKTIKPDLIHLHFGGPSGYFHLKTKSAFNPPTLTTIHSIARNYSKKNSLFRQIISSSDHIDVASKTMIPKIKRLFPDKNLNPTTTYYGLSAPKVLPTPLNINNPTLLCLGRLIPWKGFDVALKAFKILKSNYPNLKMLIAGDGSEKKNLIKLSEDLGINGSVEFLGWIKLENVYDLINMATIVLIPSKNTGGETLPTVSIQSSQMGRPVIASNITGLPEIINHKKTGLLVEQNNHFELANAVMYLLDNPSETLKIAKNAREYVLRKFRIENYVKSYDNLYRKILNNSH